MRLYFSKVVYSNLIIFSVGEHVSGTLRIFVLNLALTLDSSFGPVFKPPIGFIMCLYISTLHFDLTISCVFPPSLLSNSPSCRLCFKNKVYWGWRDASVLEHLLVLQMTWVRFPAPTRWLTTICNSSSRGLDTLFWPGGSLATQVVHICYMQAKH